VRPTALVTGAGRRVGRAISVELAETGFDLLLHAHRSLKELDETATRCRAAGATVFTEVADLGIESGIERLAEACNDAFDGLNALINNASLFAGVPFEEIDTQAWQTMMAVNLTAPFRLSQLLLPSLRRADADVLGAEADQHGVVIHLVDIGADRPISGHAHYSVSKAGLAMLVRAMAVELAPAIRTVGISPGQVAWPDGYSEKKRSRIAGRIPLQRVGSPDDVARLARFLICEAHYLNGVVVPVDGGLSVKY
jgi:pteridine reductase